MRINGLLIVLITLLGTSGASYWLGYHKGSTAAELQRLAQLASAYAERERTQRHQYQRQINAAHQAVRQLRAEKQHISQRQAQLEEQIRHERTQAQSVCSVSNRFVGLYNAAISPTAPVPAAPGAATGIAGTPSTPAIAGTPSRVQPADILQHINGYGARCQQLEQQLTSLIRYLEQHQKDPAHE